MEKVRLYPNSTQKKSLEFMLDVTRNIWNCALQERRDDFKRRNIRRKDDVFVSANIQCKEFTQIRKTDPVLKAVYCEAESAVIHRLDNAFKAFYQRVKTRTVGEKKSLGFPRFKSSNRWNTLEYPHGNRAVFLNENQTKIKVPSLGLINIRKGRSFGNYGRVFLTKKNEKWYAIFECWRDVKPLLDDGSQIGIDLGVTDLVAMSNGKRLLNPKIGQSSQHKVLLHQRNLDKLTKKDSIGRPLNYDDPQRKKAVLRLARAKEKQANVRRDSLHQISRNIVNDFSTVVLEKLQLVNMTKSAKGTVEKPGKNVAAKSGLNRVVLDAGLGILRKFIVEKAEYAARTVIFVDPKYTSQTCSRCQHIAKESRDKKFFRCVSCDYELDADVNSARNILRKGLVGTYEFATTG